jgi:peroxiredoxin/outer membrane lipoprotein-sorting protein
MKLRAIFLFACAAGPYAFGQTPEEVLQKTYQKLHAAKTLTATMHISLPGAKDQDWEVEFSKPNLYSIVGPAQQYHYDGAQETQYWPFTKMYEVAAKREVSDAPFTMGLNMFFQNAMEPKLASGEKTTLDGKPAVKVTVTGPDSSTWYLDAVTDLPLGYDESLSTSDKVIARFTDLQLDAALDSNSMVWAPPKDAKQMGLPKEESKLLAPEADAPTPAIKTIDSKDLDLSKAFATHRATLLVFWNGAPLTADLAFLHDASAQAQDQRLQIIGVELKANADTKSIQNLPFPVVMDTDGSFAKAYGVETSTEYLVGPDGKVAAHFVGFDPGGIVKVLRQRGFRI